MSHWMFNCREVTKLVSESLDRDLSILQRMGIRIHFLMCKYCPRIKDQFYFLRDAMHSHAAQRVETDPSVTLPPHVKEKIKRSLRQ
jgi:hypothetical protein